MGKRVYLSLGSNLGDRVATIRAALGRMSKHGIRLRRISSFYRTEPFEYHAQPWFANCAAEVETSLMPMQLLKALQSIERDLGRRRGIPKGPRRIDIDILLYENVVVQSPGLTIPHAGLAERRFVLIPLREIAPGLRHPASQRTVAEMLQETKDASRVVLLREP